jgi:threonyl-tRNA synthetase
MGRQMELFHMQEEGRGMVFWHHKGWVLWQVIEAYMRRRLTKAGYVEVKTPQVLDRKFWEASGHWDKYRPNMFVCETVEGETLSLKPMNCPGHVQIFDQGQRSYRELPLRMAEFGKVHRYEPSGALHGLLRVRHFTQDDAHIFCTPDQLAAEIAGVCKLVDTVMRTFGFEYKAYLATRPEKAIGDEAIWTRATEALKAAAAAIDLPLELDEGGGAFYGPKISVQARDAIGRTWQMSTIQLDFNQPERFELEYTGPDGEKHRPVMIHRALFGSIERFFAILLEHYAGAFPVWLAPVQVVGIPVAEEYAPYLDGIIAQLRAAGIRAEVDHSDDRMPKKIRTHTTQKVPLQLIAGEQDRSGETVSFRFRDGTQTNGIPVAEAVAKIVDAVRTRALVNTAEDLA